MIKVFLREKKLLHGKKGLYLDFYPPVLNPVTKRPTRREHLKLYIFERPKTETQRDHNKETRLLGENIRARRQLDLQAGAYGFAESRNRNKDFIDYLRVICESKKKGAQSNSNYNTYQALLKRLIDFAGKFVKFGDISEQFCSNFKNHLLYESAIGTNTAASYFDSFKGVVRVAADAGYFSQNPARDVKSIEKSETQREFLTLEEVRDLAHTSFDEQPDIKQAAIFSCQTGLRMSDIKKLTWGELRFSEANGHYIRFRIKKSGAPETHFISEEAFEILGPPGDASERVFPKFEKWRAHYYLPRWIEAAGIKRKITFHSFRHTYATLQLNEGTDIYTLSKLLSHKRLETTEIYAKVIDQRKREAADRIKLHA